MGLREAGLDAVRPGCIFQHLLRETTPAVPSQTEALPCNQTHHKKKKEVEIKHTWKSKLLSLRDLIL